MRVGLIGCGNVAVSAHIPALLAVDGVDLVAAADPTPERLALAGDSGVPRDALYADWRDLIRQPGIDALVVATPQRFRTEIALAGAAAGKHLLLEKPLALSPAEAQAIADAADAAGVVAATNHNYHFMPVYRSLRDAIDRGDIGTPEVAVLNFLGVEDRPGAAAFSPRWRHFTAEAGGGVLMDMLHAVYLANWFMGADPVAVTATVDKRFPDDGDVEDLALVRYDYPAGHAMVNMAWGTGPGGIEITGTAGRALSFNRDYGTHPFVPAERVAIVGPGGLAESVPAEPPRYGFAGIVEDWRDAVRERRAPLASAAAGVTVLMQVVGAYAAAALGRTLALPLSPDDPVYQHGASGISRLSLPPGSAVRRLGLFGTAGVA
ncbi:MAG: Gfo/Idh/MocA family protein [Chloroflexota bacterium]